MGSLAGVEGEEEIFHFPNMAVAEGVITVVENKVVQRGFSPAFGFHMAVTEEPCGHPAEMHWKISSRRLQKRAALTMMQRKMQMANIL